MLQRCACVLILVFFFFPAASLHRCTSLSLMVPCCHLSNGCRRRHATRTAAVGDRNARLRAIPPSTAAYTRVEDNAVGAAPRLFARASWMHPPPMSADEPRMHAGGTAVHTTPQLTQAPSPAPPRPTH
ncbi:uncharacterized protein Tco025E_03670 [Trypanosoma conorhini]|uniref:Secreted protein n=1 Tax=Trypanosoma conorhini TaxID=83891 RepID=A0A3R7LC83_9TRYP|nr:uncharacterized protein Tco025E_03670 [Trypanosoma conorhini]RNF20653.1 hypothetical protein Tco025E_03670 [Trypanosoma conorhini]